MNAGYNALALGESPERSPMKKNTRQTLEDAITANLAAPAGRAFDIFANGTIRRTPGSQPTGCTVAQLADGTTVWLDGVRLLLPAPRYALSTDTPASGIPGRPVFDRDLRAALAEIEAYAGLHENFRTRYGI